VGLGLGVGCGFGGVAFLEQQQVPRRQLSGRRKETARGKGLRLKRFEQIYIDIPNYTPWAVWHETWGWSGEEGWGLGGVRGLLM